MAKAAGKPATSKNEVAVRENKSTAVAVAAAAMFAEDAGAGFEGATKDSFAIPYLTILQSMSPQTKKSDGAYIKGATEGMIINSVTSEVIEAIAAEEADGLEVIVCAYTYTFVEWVTREKGGGFVAEHDSTTGAGLERSARKDDKGRSILPNGNQINPTHNFYVLAKNKDGVFTPAVISMTSTQIKKAKRWMTAMNQLRVARPDGSTFQPPMFANKFTLTTAAEKNDKGSWYGWVISDPVQLDVTEPAEASLYLEARAFKDSVVKGEAKVSAREADSASGPVPGLDEDNEM
jgi:hypothetical protein